MCDCVYQSLNWLMELIYLLVVSKEHQQEPKQYLGPRRESVASYMNPMIVCLTTDFKDLFLKTMQELEIIILK